VFDFARFFLSQFTSKELVARGTPGPISTCPTREPPRSTAVESASSGTAARLGLPKVTVRATVRSNHLGRLRMDEILWELPDHRSVRLAQLRPLGLLFSFQSRNSPRTQFAVMPDRVQVHDHAFLRSYTCS